jgi:hypothetical protein
MSLSHKVSYGFQTLDIEAKPWLAGATATVPCKTKNKNWSKKYDPPHPCPASTPAMGISVARRAA